MDLKYNISLKETKIIKLPNQLHFLMSPLCINTSNMSDIEPKIFILIIIFTVVVIITAATVTIIYQSLVRYLINLFNSYLFLSYVFSKLKNHSTKLALNHGFLFQTTYKIKAVAPILGPFNELFKILTRKKFITQLPDDTGKVQGG